MSYISRQELEFLGEPLGDCVTVPKLGGGYWCGIGGGGGPTSSTVTQTNIPEFLEPYVTGMIGQATQELFTTELDPTTGKQRITGTRPYTPWSPTGQYVNAQGQTVTAPGATLPEARQYVAGWDAQRQGLGSGAQTNALGLASWLGESVQRDPVTGQPVLDAQGRPISGGGVGLLNEQYGYGQTQTQQVAGSAANAAAEALGYGILGKLAGERGEQLGALGIQYGDLGANYGMGAAALAPEAQRYGRAAANIGQMGLRAEELGRDITGQARGYAQQAADIGDLYERMATSPSDVYRFMSPYQMAVTAQQQAGAQRQADIAAQSRKAAAARAGAFGGARQAIENAEANRALQSQLQGIEAMGLQQAYQQAQANILNRAQLEAQGLSGAQQGLGTALQGGQLGLSGIGQAMAGQQAGLAGLGQAGQLYGLGMQGAGMGLQGLDRALAGTAQAMQGAGIGIQGTQAATGAYGLQGAMARQNAALAAERLGQIQNIAGFQYGLGEQQRQLEQQAINQAIQNFAMAQETPYQRLAAYNALIRGYSTPGQTMTQYQAPPSGISQLAGLGLAGAGLSGLMGRKAGGTVKAGDGVDTLALNRALAGA